jgi:hypothetical protein
VVRASQNYKRPDLLRFCALLSEQTSEKRVEGRNLGVDTCSCVLDLALPPKSISPAGT